jgi:hypothetical protein
MIKENKHRESRAQKPEQAYIRPSTPEVLVQEINHDWGGLDHIRNGFNIPKPPENKVQEIIGSHISIGNLRKAYQAYSADHLEEKITSPTDDDRPSRRRAIPPSNSLDIADKTETRALRALFDDIDPYNDISAETIEFLSLFARVPVIKTLPGAGSLYRVERTVYHPDDDYAPSKRPQDLVFKNNGATIKADNFGVAEHEVPASGGGYNHRARLHRTRS